LDKLCKEESGFDDWTLKDKFRALVASQDEGDTKTILAKPQTYMNNSGDSVQALKQFYKLDNSDIIVIHDDVDIPFGEVRIKAGGGTAGHNGLESVVSHIGNDFKRLRIGIRNPIAELADTSDFVLASFAPNEQAELDSILAEVISKLDF
jgi:PTH1 family peptidyl-tRNA hydrolase